MIKNYRNSFLAAAIALTAVSCGGGDFNADDPLAGNIAGDLTGSEPAPKTAAAQAIAQLLGSSLLSLIGTTNTVFDTFAVVTSPSSSAGKLLGVQASAGNRPSGDVTTVEAGCSNGGDIKMDIQLDILKDGATTTVVPKIDDGFSDFPNGDVDITLGMNFDNCNEPTHEYDGDVNTSPVDPNESQILDGGMIIRIESENDIVGQEGNTKDFALNGTISMTDYFINSKPADATEFEPIELINGDMGISLSTTDIDNGSYNAVLDFGVTTTDNLNGGSTRTTITADGSVDLSSSFGVDGYALSLNGSLRNFGGDAAGTYTLFTESTVVSTDGGNPSQGAIGIIDTSSGLTHTAELTNTGITFTIYEKDVASPKISSCTWNEINAVNGEECVVN